MRQSAGTRSPARRTMRSPGTSSRAATLRSVAVANHMRQRRGHLPQRLERPLGAVLLHEPEQDGEQHDDRDDQRLERVAEQAGQQRGGEQNQNQDVLELRGERVPGG